MKYLKYLEDDTSIGVNPFEEQYFIGKIEGQPKQGPTVICFKNPNTGVTRTVYTGKSNSFFKEDESPIQYTWRYEESYNGHPAIIVNFSRIDSAYVKNIVCLESNNMCKGSGNYIPPNKYNINGENNNRALNVLTLDGFNLNTETEGITWYKLGDIVLNTDYPLYITVPRRYVSVCKRIIQCDYIPNDWEVRINVRPTIRGNLGVGENLSVINLTTFKHTNNIYAKEYISVKFPYRDIFKYEFVYFYIGSRRRVNVYLVLTPSGVPLRGSLYVSKR